VTVWNINTIPAPLGRGQASPLQHERFFGFADAFSAPLFSSCFARRKRNRPAVGYPPYDHQCVFRSYFSFCPFRARIIGGDFSQGVALCYGLFAPLGRVGFANVFYDPIVGCADNCRFGFADVCWRSSCRLAPTLFTKKARRSVTHLTFAKPFWRSVQTFLVLLHTEAGGTPAFQSTPLRGYCRLRRQLPFWFCRCVLAIQLSACADVIHQESPAVGYPPYVCQHVLAFSSNFFGSITHKGGRDDRVPVLAASRQLSATPTGDGLEYQHSFTPLRDEGKPRPYNVNVFWFCQCVFRSISSGASPRR
jgi:hypothetical protein